MNEYYVYIYCDPRKKGEFKFDGVDYTFNYEPFYVGMGKGYRFRRHVTNYEIDWNYNTIKNGKIKHLIESGIDPLKYVVFYKDKINKEEASNVEQELIQALGRINLNTGILSNMTDGGDGWHNAVSPFKGKTYEEIHGVEKAKALKDIRRKGLIGNNYGANTKGIKMSDAQKKNLSEAKSIPVKQMNEKSEIIKIWNSCKEAAITLGISLSGIHNVVSESQRAKTSSGFRWEFTNRVNKKYVK